MTLRGSADPTLTIQTSSLNSKVLSPSGGWSHQEKWPCSPAGGSQTLVMSSSPPVHSAGGAGGCFNQPQASFIFRRCNAPAEFCARRQCWWRRQRRTWLGSNGWMEHLKKKRTTHTKKTKTKTIRELLRGWTAAHRAIRRPCLPDRLGLFFPLSLSPPLSNTILIALRPLACMTWPLKGQQATRKSAAVLCCADWASECAASWRDTIWIWGVASGEAGLEVKLLPPAVDHHHAFTSFNSLLSIHKCNTAVSAGDCKQRAKNAALLFLPSFTEHNNSALQMATT